MTAARGMLTDTNKVTIDKTTALKTRNLRRTAESRAMGFPCRYNSYSTCLNKSFNVTKPVNKFSA